MAEVKHLETLRMAVEMWNSWRRGNPDKQSDLRGLNLPGENNRNADFHNTHLDHANIHGADLDVKAR